MREIAVYTGDICGNCKCFSFARALSARGISIGCVFYIYAAHRHSIKDESNICLDIAVLNVDRNIGNGEGFVDLLKGHVDFTAVMEAFKKIGYDGWVTAEYGCLETEDDKIIAYLKSIADAMDDILGRV